MARVVDVKFRVFRWQFGSVFFKGTEPCLHLIAQLSGVDAAVRCRTSVETTESTAKQ